MQSPSPDILTLSSLSPALIDMFFGKSVNTLWGDLGQFANIFRCMRENKWDAWRDKISREHPNICCCQEPNRKYNLIKHKTVKSKNRAINFSGSLLIQFRSLRGYWPRSGCQHKIRGMWGWWTITISRVSRSPSLCVGGTCQGKGCLWNGCSQEMSDEIIAVWEIEASEGWGPDRKTRLEFLPHYDPSPGPEEEEMMLTEQLNWNPTLLRIAGQSEALLGSVDKSEVSSVVGMAIKLKYDDDSKLEFWRWSQIKQSPHTKHWMLLSVMSSFLPPKIHTVKL